MLQENVIQETVDFALQYLGDPPGVDPYNVQAHGSAEQRAEAIKGGYGEGFLACNIMV
jgi:predicted metalloprotease